ncbi:hypothetical protein Dimus_036961, partial [Dionaea muscipula]
TTLSSSVLPGYCWLEDGAAGAHTDPLVEARQLPKPLLLTDARRPRRSGRRWCCSPTAVGRVSPPPLLAHRPH